MPVNISEVVSKVRVLESSGGVNDSCLKQGKVNGYGYRQNNHENICYKSQVEVKTLVSQWFKEKLQTMTLAEALCLYNRGIKTSDCEYYKNYKKL